MEKDLNPFIKELQLYKKNKEYRKLIHNLFNSTTLKLSYYDYDQNHINLQTEIYYEINIKFTEHIFFIIESTLRLLHHIKNLSILIIHCNVSAEFNEDSYEMIMDIFKSEINGQKSLKKIDISSDILEIIPRNSFLSNVHEIVIRGSDCDCESFFLPESLNKLKICYNYLGDDDLDDISLCNIAECNNLPFLNIIFSYRHTSIELQKRFYKKFMLNMLNHLVYKQSVILN